MGTSVARGRFIPMTKNHALLISMLLVSAGSAFAQAPPSPSTPPQQTVPPAPERTGKCAAMENGAHSGAAAPEGQTTGQARAPLSDKLAQSDGVLCPPAGVDPEMHAPAPEAGKTPVIPPPGSPGGDPSVRPK
jgi:hypothetical protein